jgi:hypothetical protein
MSVASTPGHMDHQSLLTSGMSSGAPPSGGLFTVPSKIWDSTNLEFEHLIAGKSLRETAHKPHQDPRRFPVPLEQVTDLTSFTYGAMPQALTLRPHMETGCCSGCDRKYDVARDLFADPIAEVKVAIPCNVCFFNAGCSNAEVEVYPKHGVTGVVYKGEFGKNFLAGCLDNTLKLQWSGTKSKPYMSYRSPACCDQLRYVCCQTVWIGWRGSSEAVPQNQALYDNSTIMRCNDAWSLCCLKCKTCQNACCFAMDYAPRWVRPDDIRRLILAKYDYEFAHRNIEEEINFELSEGENTDKLSITQQLQPIQKVDLLLTSRLYQDVSCGKPTVRFANNGEGNKGLLAAVDARYRGSLDHANPSEDDHLIALAATIMHGIFTFPNKAKAPYSFTPADMLSGRLMPRGGSNHGSANIPSNTV